MNRTSNNISDKYICTCHFEDDAIIDFIERNTSNKENVICAYCDFGAQESSIVSLTKLTEFVKEGITNYYGTPDGECLDYDEQEGGWIKVELLDTLEVLESELYVDDRQILIDVESIIPELEWVRKDPYYPEKHHQNIMDWNQFGKLVKHKIRFSSYSSTEFDSFEGKVSDILTEIARGVDKLELITKLSPETIFYRCRQHSTGETPNSIKELGSPPLEYCTSENRMSPAGISMFYGAFDQMTAKVEVINNDSIKDEPMLTMGNFQLKEPLHVIDLTRLPEPPSIFKENNRELYHTVWFLRYFIDDVSKVISPDKYVHIEYIPTQVVTEYFRYILPDEVGVVNGIVYPSSKNTNGKCCVLFMDDETCKECLNLIEFKTTNLSES